MRKHIVHLYCAKRLVTRIWRLKKRIKLLVVLAFLVYLSILSQIYAAFWVYPNTRLGNADISGKTSRDIDRLIEQYAALSYRVRVQNREYQYTYPDLGVAWNHQAIKRDAFSRNRKPFPLNALALIQSWFQPTTLSVPLVFTQEFRAYIDQTIFDFSDIPDTISFDPRQKSLVYVENEERYKIDEQYFIELLKNRIGDNGTPLYPKLTRVRNEKAELVERTSDQIKNIFLSPLTVMMETSGTSQTFLLSEKELADVAAVELSPDQTTVTIGVNREMLTQLVNDHVKRLKLITHGSVVTPKVEEDMQSVLMARFNGHTADALTIGLDNGPNTTGSTASKYIEVDLSQQKMYLFRNGKLYKTYRVSTGLEYPTPTGEFQILNKTGLGYSRIYNVWMPYWMGFKYSDELHAYFGIHELPYTEVDGKQKRRPSDFIGAPNTGGCVALDVGAAKEVYQFADIGTKVVIYN